MTYTRKAAIGFAWIAAGVVIANVFGYLLRLLLARNLGVEEYGLVYAVMATFGLVSIFQNLGLGEAITKYTAAYTAQGRPQKIKESILWSMLLLFSSTAVIALVAYLLADWLGAMYFDSTIAAPLVKVYAIGIFLSPLGTILLAVFRGRQQMHYSAAYQAAQSILLFLATALLVLRFEWGAMGAIAAYIVMYVCMYVIFLPLLRTIPDFFKKRTSLQTSTPKMLLAYGLPVMLTGVAGIILTYTDTVLLTVFSSLDEVGIYQAALPTANILLAVNGIVGTVLLPMVAELWEKKRSSLISSAVRDLYRFVFLAVLPGVVGFVVYPAIIMNLLFGAEYVAAGPILAVLSLGSLFLILNGINAATLSGLGTPKENTKAVFIGAGVNLGANLILIPLFGGLGAAISTLFSSVMIFLASTYLLHKDISVKFPTGAFARTAVAGVAFALVLVGARTLAMNQYVKVALAVIAGGLLYVAVAFLMRAITWEEVMQMKERVLDSRRIK